MTFAQRKISYKFGEDDDEEAEARVVKEDDIDVSLGDD